MMNNIRFRTPITIHKTATPITHLSPMMTLGSCFSANIGEKILKSGFNGLLNPFGIIYNPISIANAIIRIIEKKEYVASDLFYHNSQWISFDHHGKYSSSDSNESLNRINSEISAAHQMLNQHPILLITFGSAHAYEHINQNQIVANCHKIKASEFTKKLLSVDEIVDQFSELLISIPHVKVIFTVSPVRYLSDGFFENQISKSILLLSISKLKAKFENVDYFPAYEIMNDDLRDYRFYSDDMIHPSSLAIDYIWSQFRNVFFDTQTQNIITEVETLYKSLNHRFLKNNSEEQKQFIQLQIAKINQLSNTFPSVNLLDLKQQFSDKLSRL